VVTELERNMKFDDKVLKYMSVKKAERANLEEIEKETTSVSKDEEAEEITPAETVEAPDIDTEDDTVSGETQEESSEEKEQEK
ncbi:unnamed protein product, partial [marine sediment metagenome]